MKNIIELIKQHKPIVGALSILVLAAGLLFTLNTLKHSQENQSKAGGSDVALFFNPSSSQISANSTLDVDLMADSGTKNITGADVTISYTSNIMSVEGFTPSSALSTVIRKGNPAAANDAYQVVIVNTGDTTNTGTVKLGTFKFRVNSSYTSGVATVRVKSSQITAAGVRTALAVYSDGAIGTYSETGSATPSAGVEPTATPTVSGPTPTPTLIAQVTSTPTPLPTIPAGCFMRTYCYMAPNGGTYAGCTYQSQSCGTGEGCFQQLECPVSPTIVPNATSLGLKITYSGLSNNMIDSKKTREATIILSDAQNQQSLPPTKVYVTADGGTYFGQLGIAGNFAAGNYTAKVKLDNTLYKQLPGIITITLGQYNQLPAVVLTPGDLNQNNQLEIADYNLLLSCYGTKECPMKDQADLNGDGKVDEIDINMMQRAFASRDGD